MKAMNTLIAVAGLFISGVLVFLVIKGVVPKERRMVKWSGVTSATEAGSKIGRFFYPILKEKGDLLMVGEGSFPEEFFEAFQKEARSISPDSKVSLNTEQGNPSFIVEFRNLDDESLQGKCSRDNQEACIWAKSRNKFLKKDRSTHPVWINGYRLNESKALFFYKSN